MQENTHIEVVSPVRSFRGSVRLPGDKSISHRYAMLAGLAKGTSKLANFSTGADPHSSLKCMEQLGATVRDEGGAVSVTGVGGTFAQPAGDLDCGNSGSTMRMLAGLVAPHAGTFRFVGDASLTKRPMERIRGPLQQMGARIDLTEGHAPMTVHGGPLQAIRFETPIASAQVKTAVLFAGLQANGLTELKESVRTRDHSEHALRAFGAELERDAEGVRIAGGQTLQAIEATVPGDLSSAAFFLCAALLFPESQLVLDDLGMNPSRSALLDVLVSMGLRLQVLNLEEKHGELIGTVQANGSADLKGAEISGSLSAQLIDELPVLAAVAPYTRTGVTIRDAKELRVKESDRIALVVRNLRNMGAEVEELEDGMIVPGGQTLHGGVIDSGDDHRIAMAFSIAALRASSDTAIHGAEAAAISFPEFFPLLRQLGAQ
ncbi:3-phosphoshikimate 1-carboxyvinyltransferase [Terriglobus aquaticus]|uniref:3-phosphoshikimate 1-carboxyvinyltransferase n=1 Tax=Terriglobus aquaticus TaxID=940139 RepID=A0ABW9KM97_9BACT|nr:3-phosphoshikimate 1-carboxyvinyltransferase [Terriglobus aquaticus]